MTVTLDDLKKSKTRERMHLNGGSWFGYIHQCVEYPRLSRFDRYVKKDRSVTSTWRVDGADVADLEAAVVALNLPPNVTLEERAALDLVPVEFTPARDVRTLIGGENRQHAIEVMTLLDNKGLIEYQDGKVRRRP